MCPLRIIKPVKKRLLISLGIMMALILSLVLGLNLKNGNRNIIRTNPATDFGQEAANLPEPKSQTATFLAVGDMLIHDDVYDDFKLLDGSFDFKPAFELVKPIIQKADFAVVNQETILGGVDLGLSGLYVANSPQEAGDAYVDTGFNIIQLANNHAYDRGIKGIDKTLEFWQKYRNEVITSGVYANSTERSKIPIIEKKGIKLAYLSYSFGSNLGIPPEPYVINMINKYQIETDVIAAKSQADVVAVGMHWGEELKQEPNSQQVDLAKFMANLGVDIIVGTHPHMLQPPEWVKGKNGNQTLVMYSLGNFLSIHTEDPLYTLTGAIMGVHITKEVDGSIKIANPTAVLTWNYFAQDETGFKVTPFNKMNQNQFYWGDWLMHKQNMETFIKSKITDLSIEQY